MNNSVKIEKNSQENNESENNATEVFVMPPNVLEKLGINLGTIYGSTDSMVVVDNIKQVDIDNQAMITDFNISNTQNATEDNDSIMETANLMKKSVFLSPTFIPTDLNVISGEVEIAKIEADHRENIVPPVLQPNENLVSVLENNNKYNYDTFFLNNCTSMDVEMNNVDIQCEFQNMAVQSSRMIEKNDNVVGDHKQHTMQPIFSNNEVLYLKDTKIKTDKSFISSDSSNCSNSNTTKNSLAAVSVTNEVKKKIGILSEETLDSAKHKTLFLPSKTIVTPVPVNTLITLSTDTQFSTCSQSMSNNILESNVLNEESNILPSNEIIEDETVETLVSCESKTPLLTADAQIHNTLSNNISANLSDRNSFVKNDIKDLNKIDDKNVEEITTRGMNGGKGNNDFNLNKDETVINEAKIKDVSNTNNVTILQNKCMITDKIEESDKNIPVDKVTEIATYLSSFYKLSNNKSKKLKNNNLRESDTKLSIQGVEKPGGPKLDSKRNLQYQNIQTYQRQRKTHQSVLSTLSQNHVLSSNMVGFAELEEQITINTCPVILKSRHFCNCSDFGQFSFYDDDKPYEHIHFLNPANVDNLTEENNAEINSTDNIVFGFNICLNNIVGQEGFLMDANKLISHMNAEINKQVYGKDNFKFLYEVNSEEDVDYDNNIFDADSLKEDDGFQEKCEISVIVQHIKREETEEANNMLLIQPLEDVNDKDLESDTESAKVQKETRNGDKNKETLDVIPKNVKVSDLEQLPQLHNVDERNFELMISHGTRDTKWRNSKEKEPTKQTISTSENYNGKKRKLSVQTNKQDDENNIQSSSKVKAIKCGVCNKILQEFEWESHISSDHCYVAWQDGATLDLETYLEDKVLLNKINDKLKMEGILMCTFCKISLKRESRFVKHVIKCYNSHKSQIKTVTCGVCAHDMKMSSWMEHIAKSHDYLAWKKGETPLDLSDDVTVWNYLNAISKDIDGLVCAKCGLVRKYVKQYLAHIKKCQGDANDSMTSFNTSQEMDSSKVQDEFSTKNLKVNVRRKMKTYSTESKLNFSVMESDAENLKNNISQKDISDYDSELDASMGAQQSEVRCGVCSQEMEFTAWMNHMQKEHNYMAWKDCEPPLDLSDIKKVKAHLLDVVSKIGCLTCSKCGITKKKPQVYLNHMEVCEKSLEESKKCIPDGTTVSTTEVLNTDESCECAICSKTLTKKNWEEHSMDKHYNLAWIKGENAYDYTDKNIIISLLTKYRKQCGKMVCKSCGVSKKSVLGFYSHIACCRKSEEELAAVQGKCDTCNKKYLFIYKDKHVCVTRVDESAELNSIEQSESDGGDMCQCGLCLLRLQTKDWGSHVMNKHYNIAWMVGQPALDLNNPNMVDKQLREYKGVYGRFVCNVCRISKASTLGFYAHVLVCGKTEEETEQFKALCNVCNKKYMRIYEYQHMRAHRDTELARERKLITIQQNELIKDSRVDHVVVFDSKRNRKAAEKAKDVIEKYSASNNFCERCESNREECKCVRTRREMRLSESGSSVQSDQFGSESNHSTDVEIDENISDEEEIQERRRKKHTDSFQLKTERIPFRIASKRAYIEQSFKNFCKTHLTDEILFDKWHNFEYEFVSENELEKYLPPIKESCKVQMGKNEWQTIQRFQAEKDLIGMGIFAGGSVQCIRWAPSRLDEYDGQSGHWLATVAHLSTDQPRYNIDELSINPALIQLWDVGDYETKLPKLSLGLAHDKGTIWAMDWCPSGARDPLPLLQKTANCENPLRLGLLAVACSNGIVYIYAIPYPSTVVKDDNIFIKLKPTAELRLAEGEDRKLYQATSLRWSPQKGHSHIIVGYADGTVAFYDVNSESPLLKTTEGDLVIFSPYHDERFQNSCITGVDIYPSSKYGLEDGAGGMGAWCAASISSAALRVGGVGRCPRAAYSTIVSSDVVFSPHWPSLLLAVDDALATTAMNELEIWGQGRRIGGICAIAACQRCSQVACFSPPFVRTMITHPINKEVIKKFSTEIVLAPIGSKKIARPAKDELTVRLEPSTYDETIAQYGIKIKPIDKIKLKSLNGVVPPNKDIRADRFPLADVTGLAFCTTAAYHDTLAVATHAGLVFFVKV